MHRAFSAALLLVATAAFAAAPQALVVEADWTRFDQRTELRYTHLGTQTRIDTATAAPADPFLLIDTAQDQRLTVYRHNSSWRLDPLEPKPRGGQPAMPGRPAAPQPPPGIGPQGTIGPRAGSGAGNTAAVPPTPGYGAPAGYGPSIPQSAISKTLPQVGRDPQSPAPAGIGPQGPLGPRTSADAAAMPEMPPHQEMPPMPAQPEMPQPPAGFGPPAQMGVPPGVGPQNGIGPGAMPPLPGAGMGPGIGGGMPMPPPMGLGPREEPDTALTKTEETQTLLGRTAVKYTLAGRMLETIEIWAVPDTEFGPFFAYRPQPPHRFGPVDLQDQWDGFIRREKLFPLLVILRQGEREIARFAVTKIETREVAEPATFFAPPPAYYKCLPDPF